MFGKLLYPCVSGFNAYQKLHFNRAPRNLYICIVFFPVFLESFLIAFCWVSKVTRICFDFSLLRFVIGLQFSRHFLILSEVKPETDHAILKRPITTDAKNATNTSDLEEKHTHGVKGGKTHGRRQA